MSPAWPPELRALAALLSEEDRPAPPLSEAAWERLATLAISRHRVAPLLAERLPAEAPHAVRDALAAAQTEAAFTALAQKQETRRLTGLLAAAEAPAIVLKGWPLAERLYGAASARQAKDIDLFVAPEALPVAIACLEKAGYAPLAGLETRRLLAHAADPALLAETNDIALVHPAGHMVELHWRLTHLAGWLDLATLPDATTSHPIDATGETVRVLSDRANLIYLAVHGQLHLWGRLRWLHDVARLLSLRPGAEVMADLAAAERLGAGRALRLAGHLAAEVFAAPLPPDWPPGRWLERRALAQFRRLIAAPGGEPGRPTARLGYYLGILALGEGLTQRLAAPRYAIWRNARLHWAGRARA
ncbi:MAG: nucleotidyltransferase family protein, partial [Pseudomonadota bacterium]